MTTRTLRNVGLAALLFWLVVAGYGVRELTVHDGGEDWELSYAFLATALPLAVALTVTLLAAVTREGSRRGLRAAGLVVGGLGAGLALVGAWAVPVWATILGLGLVLLALATPGQLRRPIAIAGSGLLVAVALQFTALALLGSSEDSAADFAIIVAAVTVMFGLVEGGRVHHPTTPRGVVPAEA